MTLLPVEHVDADVAIVGSGFAGSLTALCLRRRGFRVAIVERGRHPRFAIGESSTPLANLLIEELADRYDLTRLRPFSKWGTWQRARPDVACGLKRGFTFFFHRAGEPFPDDPDRARQLLVAASPHDEVGDTHWYRPAFDHALVREAEAEGVIHLDETQVTGIRQEGARTTIEGTRAGRTVRIVAAFVIDASGPRGFLHRALPLAEQPLRWLPRTQGLYTHFENVERWDRLRASPSPASVASDAAEGTANDASPYPVDDAALHHVFPGGWIWMLRFNNGITSAGVAMTDAVAAGLMPGSGPWAGAGVGAGAGDRAASAMSGHAHASEPELHRAGGGGAGAGPGVGAGVAGRADEWKATAWARLLDSLPSVRDQFHAARVVHPFVHAPRVAFRSAQVCGDTWALLPSAAGVIDPLLSTGFPLTLLGIARLVDLLERTAAGSAARGRALRAYEQTTIDELDVTEQLVGAMYANMGDPALFKRLGLLYFAAAGFSEAVRRLGRPELAPGFLLHAHPRFGPELRACAAMAAGAPQGAAREALFARIDRAIEPFDTAGLLDRSRRDWYPVRAEDLIAGASKLEATVDEVHRLLERSGFTPRAAAAGTSRTP